MRKVVLDVDADGVADEIRVGAVRKKQVVVMCLWKGHLMRTKRGG